MMKYYKIQNIYQNKLIYLFALLGVLFSFSFCKENEPSPQTVDILGLATLDSIVKSNTCTIVALDGSNHYYRVTYLTKEGKNLPELGGQDSRFLRVALNAGEIVEIRSTTTNLDIIKLGYFKGENCLFDSRESPNKSLSNVRPIGVTDFTTTSNSVNYQAFQTSASGYYNIQLRIDAERSARFNDIIVNYK